jgi:hypothetical protein
MICKNIYKRTEFEILLILCYRRHETLKKEDIEFINKIYKKQGKINIIKFGEKNNVLPFIAHLMIYLKLDKKYWQNIHNEYKKRNKKIFNFTNKMFKEFNEEGIEILLIENYGALLLSSGCIGCFTSNDIDLVSDLQYKGKIVQILNKYGFKLQERKLELENIRIELYNPNIIANGFWINIMWQPFSRKFIPTLMDFKLEELNKGKTKIGNSNICLPSHTKLLFLCLLHSYIHCYIKPPGLKLYIDIDRLVNNRLINWNEIILLSQKYNVNKKIALSIQFAKCFLNSDFPKHIIANTNFNKYFKYTIYNILTRNSIANFNNTLIIKIQNFLIECFLDDYGLLRGLFKILFPSRNWLMKIYGNKTKNYFLLYIKRIIDLKNI